MLCLLVAGVGHDPTTSGLYPFGYKWLLFEKITLVLMYFANIFVYLHPNECNYE